MSEEIGTLEPGMIHPSAHIAMDYIKKSLLENDLFKIRESMASCAIEGNRHAEICGETLRRILDKEPVSDRYVMGLAWFLYSMENKDE